MIGIWESIIKFNRPLNIIFIYSFNIFWRCWVNELKIRISWVESIYEFINISVPFLSISKSKIISKGYEKLVRSIVRSHFTDPIINILSSIINIICLQCYIINNWFIIMSTSICFITKSWRLGIMIKQSMSKNLRAASSNFREWVPDPFKRLFLHSFIFIFSIDSCKEKCFKPYLRKYHSICRRVSKWINLPSYFWSYSKLF